MKCVTRDYIHILGPDALVGSSIAQNSGDVVEFLVTPSKQPNYLTHCNQLTCATNPVATVNKYTDHTTSLYSHVNLSLASDSHVLRKHGEYIQDLRSSILSLPLLDDGPFYRGVDMSKREVDRMEELKHFFIPSFTSTSIDRTRAYSKTAMLVIKTSFSSKYACSITPDLSKFYHDEKEVLIACYSAFFLERVEKVNNTNVITLWLDEFSSSSDNLTSIF